MKKILLSTIALMMSVAMMAVGLGDGSSKANALDFDWATDNVHDATEALWYNVSLAPVNAAKEPAVVLYLTNLTDEEATVDVTVSIASAQRTVTYTIAARDYYRLDIPVDQYREFITLDEISLMIKSNVKLSLGAKVYEFDEYVQEAIANSEPIDWNSGVQQDALSTKWYDVDITSLKTNKEHLQVTFTNKASNQALVSATFVFEGKHVSLPLPIPAGFTTTKVIDYQLLSKLPARVSRIHVGVTTDSPLEVATSTFSAIAADPTPCENAINPVHGQVYTHEAGATEWYKISMDLLKSQSATQSVYLANKSDKKAHVTIGLVPDCQYTTGTKVTLPLPAGFELGALAPNLLGRLVEELQRFENTYGKLDAKDVYLEVHSDQALEFGLDVNNAITNPCLRTDLISFDWNNGVQVEADKAAWYDVDITTIKNDGKHVKLTFTNPTQSIVWVATVVSVNCPAELTVPMIVPVPAGMSVDHVIDYSIFAAADVDHLYVGVKAEDVLKLTAETIDADASASNQADCNAATLVESGKTYTHKAGAHWYHFPMSLLDNMGDAARVTFKNNGAKTAILSAGVTVDCQYGIVNRVPVKVPNGVDMSLSVPARVINKVREWIDADVADFYLHLDSDQDLAFGVDMDAVSVTACSSAVDFDWQAWEANGLQIQANQDVWYKVNLDYPLEKLQEGEDIVVSLSNLANDMDVEVEIAVSPTCPALVSLEKFVTIPANEKLIKEFSYKEVMALLDRYNKYVYDSESEKLLGHYDTYVFFNKLEKLMGRYGKYVPFGQIDMLLKRYGARLTVSGIIDMIENYEQYITVASLKKQLAAHKEYVSYDQLMGLLDQYGDYIPSSRAKQLLDQYGEYIPYLGGGAVMLLDQCEKYFTTDDLQKVVNKLKQHLPIDELKQLLKRYEKYLPEDNTCYVNVKSKGNLVVDPEPPIVTPEGCDAAVELDYNKTYNLSELPTGWYKVGLDGIHAAQKNLELKLNNDLGKDTLVTVSAYKSCDDAKPLATRARKMRVGLNTESIPYVLIQQYASGIDTLYMYIETGVHLCGTLSCESAVAFPWNTTVVVDKEAWYTISVDDLLALDTLIATVRNTTDLTVSANIEVSVVCPVDEDVIAVVKDFVAGYEKKEVMTVADVQDNLDQYGAYPGDVIYMHICPVGALELTLNAVRCETTTAEFTKAICEGDAYTWDVNGVTYNNLAVGVHEFTHNVENGCNVTINTLKLTVINDDTAMPVENKAICAGESYTWHGTAYTAAGDYVYEEVLECGKVIYSLHLEVMPSTGVVAMPVENKAICAGESYTWHGTAYTAAGDYVYEEVLECGKVIYSLHLEVMPSTGVVAMPVENKAICAGETYTWHGTAYTAAGDYVYEEVLECGKVIYSLHLEVNNCEEPCLEAEAILWNTPIHLEANTNKWYKVDVASAVAENKNIELVVINGAVENTVFVEYGVECPSEDWTVTTKTLAANAVKRTVITPEELAQAGAIDYVYVHIVTTGEVSAKAEFEPETEPCLEAEYVLWNTPIHLEANTNKWYKVDVASAVAENKNIELVVINGAVENTVFVEYGVECPSEDWTVTTKTLAANAVKRTVITPEELAQAGAIDYVYVHIVTTGEVSAKAEFEQETEPCLEAEYVLWNTPIHLEANTNKWYKVDVASAVAENKNIELVVINGAVENTVFVEYGVECPSEDWTVTTKTLAANAVKRTVITPEELAQAGAIDYVYVHIITTGEVSAKAEFEPETEPCLEAEYVLWNTPIHLEANTNKWYKVDVASAVAENKNIELVVINGAVENTVFVEYGVECPSEDWTVTTKTLAANAVKRTVITPAELAQAGAIDYVYVHIITTGEVSAKAEFEPETEPCLEAEALTVECGTTIQLEANTDKWYKLDVAAITALDENVRLVVENGSEDNTIGVEYGVECPSDSWTTTKPYTISANAKKAAIITQNDLDMAGVIDYVYVHITTTGELTATVKCCYEYATITGSVCDGDIYEDPITGKEHVISSLIAASQTWNDTVITDLACDSIYTFVITPTVAPQVMTEDLLATIPGALPTLNPGCTVDVAGTIEAIKAYYELNDTEAIADVVNVEWTAGADAKLDCDATEHAMTLKVEAGCDFVINTTIKLTVEPIVANEHSTNETICEGESYTWAANGKSYTPTATMTDVYEVTNDCGCVVDRYTLTLTVNKATETTLDAIPVEICETELPYAWNVADTTILCTETKTYTHTVVDGCSKTTHVLELTVNKVEETTLDAIPVEICETELPYAWNVADTTILCTETKTYTHTVVDGCSKTTHVLEFTVNKVEETTLDAIPVEICETELPYIWTVVEGVTIECDKTDTYTYTIDGDCSKTTHVLELTVNKVEETTLDAIPVAICESELPYIWTVVEGVTVECDKADTYTYTIDGDCSKTTHVLTLTVYGTPEDVVEYDTICPGETITWNGETFATAGEHTLTLQNENGCDYQATLHLHIPDPENFVDYDQIPAESKYGGRMMVINLNAIDSIFGWRPAEGDVKWFKVVGEVDNAFDALNGLGDPAELDEFVHTGYYHTALDGSVMPDSYYALIVHEMVSGECQEILRTTVLSSGAAVQAPQLVPTIAEPNDQLRILNLNPSNVTEVRVFNTSGELIENYTASEATEFVFKAATMQGYYMVEVQSENDKVTLRYIVK